MGRIRIAPGDVGDAAEDDVFENSCRSNVQKSDQYRIDFHLSIASDYDAIDVPLTLTSALILSGAASRSFIGRAPMAFPIFFWD